MQKYFSSLSKDLFTNSLACFVTCTLILIGTAGCGKENKQDTKQKATTKKAPAKTSKKDSKKETAKPKVKKHSQREHMTYEELFDHSTKALAKNRKKEAIPYLEEIASRFADREDISKHKLHLAQLYFDTKDYAAAREVFDHFAQFYPSDAQAEYAKYTAIKAVVAQSLQMDCDQTETSSAVTLCKEYLENTQFEAYRKDVVDIKIDCEKKLIDKEIYVFNFYLKQHQFDAARNRLTFLKDTYGKKDDSIKTLLLDLDYKLTSKQCHASKGTERQKLEKELQLVAADLKKAQSQDVNIGAIEKLAERANKKEKDKSYWL